MRVRSVLCFGDSNTHGQIPGRGPLERYDRATRWPGVLQAELGSRWYVIEEGLSGRTTVHDDPIEGTHKNGRTYLRPCIQSHTILDLVIIMLGTNDLKVRFNKPPSEVAMGMGCLIYDIRELAPGPGGSVPEIMIVAPPPMLDDIKEWKSIFAGGPEKSRQLGLEFEIMADSLGVHFFNAGTVCQCDEADGFHLNAGAHRALGVALAQEIDAIGWPAGDSQR
ncbi:lysophospholipase L1-like esterase [Bradyrhizobium sp. USDA 4518]|uniref:SGNH/GDSL hydrolase family protein n=1 Tax=Bradyrhizobium TaxID=374 RepID=UPI00190F1701|nr:MULTISPECIES: SGNH/GDSL hydrolase family protein [Bradyrhizobium]MCC8944011.1 SGNH/GDSL hydrolase family protein [Bradyrhizobium brasilense]MCP1853158.1 lysophospholipase L1-like esterase [Bradyrhizobium sp. USDA 4541]